MTAGAAFCPYRSPFDRRIVVDSHCGGLGEVYHLCAVSAIFAALRTANVCRITYFVFRMGCIKGWRP